MPIAYAKNLKTHFDGHPTLKCLSCTSIIPYQNGMEKLSISNVMLYSYYSYYIRILVYMCIYIRWM